MKQSAFIVLFLVAALGIAMFWNQQSAIKPAKFSQKPPPSNTAQQAPLPKEVAIEMGGEANVEMNTKANLKPELKQSTITEEVIQARRQVALETSGYFDKVQEANDARNELLRTQAERAKRLSPNRRIKERLNIDVVKDFNVDFDAKSEEIRTLMRAKHGAELIERLEASGMTPDQREQLLASRNQMYVTEAAIEE